MTVLVTGGAGFIGSHLVDALHAEGEPVRVLDNLDPLAHASGRPEHLSLDAELVVGDLCDREVVDRCLEGVDRVFHLGGVVGNGESMVNVRRAVDANCGGTATLLEAVIARRDTVRRVVVASSMVVYGEGAYACPEHGEVAAPARTPAQLRARHWELHCPLCDLELAPVPTHEDRPLRPTSVYGITKRDQEELCLTLGAAYGFEAVALRYLNTYGPRQALANPYTGVAAIFAARLRAGRAPRIFEDGGQLRDLTHVSDTVAATLAAMESSRAAGLAVNVATGVRTSILELARAISAATDAGIEPEVTGEARTGDIRHCFADVSLAESALGFRARVGLGEGLGELVEWLSGQDVAERGDEAHAALRERGLIA